MKISNYHKIILMFIVFIILFNNIYVYAENNKSYLKEEINKLKEDLIKQEEYIDELEEEVDFQLNELESLEVFKAKTKREIKDLNNQKDKNTELFQKRLRVLYMLNDSPDIFLLISIFSKAQSISDLIDYWEAYKYIIKHDQDLLKNQKNNYITLQSKEDMLYRVENESKEQLQELNELLNNLEEEKHSLNQKVEELEVKLAEILKKEYLEELKKQREAMLQNRQRKFNIDPDILYGLTSDKGFVWPSPTSKRITSPFGYRIHPTLGIRRMHTGVDIGAKQGTPVLSAIDGVVVVSGWMGGYGKTIMISNGDITVLYGHNSELLVNEGDYVEAGDIIAEVGSTGRSTGPHIHFEVKIKGQLVDPLSFFQ